MDPAAASIIVSAVTALGLVVAAFFANRKMNQTHDLVNSRMTELLELTRNSSRAEGVEAERTREVGPPQQVEVVNEAPVPVTVQERIPFATKDGNGK